MDKQNWEDNEFQKKVRIKEEDLEWLKKTKGKKTRTNKRTDSQIVRRRNKK